MAKQTDIALTMTAILGTMLAVVAGLVMIQQRPPHHTFLTKTLSKDATQSSFLPSPVTEPSKRAYEIFVAYYTPIWISIFGIIVVFQLYQDFTAQSYLIVCVGLALPFLLQPFIVSSLSSLDAQRPLRQRYAFKANLWLAVYSFIGNYWYTHYFYSVLQARYTMPSPRLNNVPIPLFFATHFYFSSYHLASNCLLRKITTTFVNTWRRTVLLITVILVFAYLTAFMETLTISSYPDYSFANRDRAYTVGSAFYGIYFIVSFPAFFYFDTTIDQGKPVTALETFVSSCGYGMIILTLLDFVRLYLNIPLVVK